MSDTGEQSRLERDADAEAVEKGQRADADTAHLDDIEDGCGCAEVWEHTSEQREE